MFPRFDMAKTDMKSEIKDNNSFEEAFCVIQCLISLKLHDENA